MRAPSSGNPSSFSTSTRRGRSLLVMEVVKTSERRSSSAMVSCTEPHPSTRAAAYRIMRVVASAADSIIGPTPHDNGKSVSSGTLKRALSHATYAGSHAHGVLITPRSPETDAKSLTNRIHRVGGAAGHGPCTAYARDQKEEEMSADNENSPKGINKRKADHIALCASGEVEFRDKGTLLDEVWLVHDALPDRHFDEVDLTTPL